MNFNKKIKELRKYIKKYKTFYIMSHEYLDLDAISSSLGLYEIIKHYGRNVFLIINDTEHEAGVNKIIDSVKNKYNIITSDKIKTVDNKNEVLIYIDVNKPYISQDKDINNKFNNIFIIDHHSKNEMSVNATFELIDFNSSSACEIIAKFIYYYDIILPINIMTYLLSGIVLDTNNYTVKTFPSTFYISYYLTKNGADKKEVQYLLKQDIEDYILRQRVITDVEVINNKIAVAVGSQKVKYKREELAKIADTLLEFNKIEESYVIGRLTDDMIGISGRSIGKRNVGKVLEKLGGGGDKFEAATKIEDKTLKEVLDELKKVI